MKCEAKDCRGHRQRWGAARERAMLLNGVFCRTHSLEICAQFARGASVEQLAIQRFGNAGGESRRKIEAVIRDRIVLRDRGGK